MIFACRPLTSAWAVNYYRTERLRGGDHEAARSITQGTWQGRGAERLGLTGGAAAVERAALLAVLQGRSPSDGSDLLPPGVRKLRRSVAWDFGASPDKSVSLVALLGPDPRIVEAHLAAAACAFAVLEQQALAKHPVHRLVPTGNLVIARFDHCSSRALDPHLHSHHLIFNLTDRAGVQPRSVAAGRPPAAGRGQPPRAAGPARPSAEWRALVTRGLYAAQPLASAVYEAELARGLQALGYELSANERGHVRILGIPDAAVDAFSKRRREVLALLARQDVATAGSHRFARVSKRAAKLRHPDLAVLQSGWRAEAERLGVDVARLRRAADQRLASHRAGALPASGEPSERARAAVAWAVEWLGEREDVFRAMDLETLALRRVAARGPRLDEIRAAIASHPQVIRRDAYAWALGELPAAALTTTDATIRIEVHNLALVRAGRLARGAPILTRPYASAAGAGATLTPDQLHVARRILESRAAVLAVAGRPGPGKTATLAAVHEAAAAAGWSIRACAATAGAKARLRQAGIETVSVKSLAPDLVPGTAEFAASSGSPRRLEPGAPPSRLWIVDEAELLSHRDAAAALDGAQRAGARLVLIGERRDYHKDEAGRPWAAFQDAGLRPARLDPVRRPPDPELPRALQLAAAGRAGDAMRHLDAAGQVVEIAGARERHAAMVRELIGPAPGAGGASTSRRLRDSLMIAPSPAERRELNTLARRELVARGVVAPAGVTFEILVSKGLTDAQRGDPRRYEVGDVLTYSRPSRAHGVRGGETVRVVAVAAEPGSRIVTVARHRDGAVVGVNLRRGVGSDLARVESRELAAGDRVQFQRADRPRSIVRGALATVTVASPDRLVLLLDPSRKRACPRVVTLEPGSAPLALDLGYAIPPPVTNRRPVATVRVLAAIATRHDPELVNRRQTLVTLAQVSHRLTVFTDDRAALPGAVDRQPSSTSSRRSRQGPRRDRHAAAPLSRDAALGSSRNPADRQPGQHEQPGHAAWRPPAEPPGRAESIHSGHPRGGALPAAAPARRDRARAGRGADRALRPRDPLPRHGAERSAREEPRPHGAAPRGRRPGDAAERDSPLRRLGAALDPGDPRPGLSAGDRARSAAPSLAQQLIAAAERWQGTVARPASAALSPLYRIEDPERQLVRLVERIGPARALATLPPALAQAVRGLREVARLLDGPSLGR